MKSEKRKISKPHVLILKLTDKLDLRRGEKSFALSNLSIYYTWKNIKSSYATINIKISASTCIDKFELPGESYSVPDTQECFEYIFRKHGESIYNPSIRIYVNKIEKKITFKTKTRYNLKL